MFPNPRGFLSHPELQTPDPVPADLAGGSEGPSMCPFPPVAPQECGSLWRENPFGDAGEGQAGNLLLTSIFRNSACE